jgi:hypothetical protein
MNDQRRFVAAQEDIEPVRAETVVRLERTPFYGVDVSEAEIVIDDRSIPVCASAFHAWLTDIAGYARHEQALQDGPRSFGRAGDPVTPNLAG